MITGKVQGTKTNEWGYTSYRIDGTWYGGDKKAPAKASEGDAVTFEAFNKPGKDGREFPTIKLDTLRKVAAVGFGSGSVAITKGDPSKVAFVPAKNEKDSYWADKEKRDLETQPRIVYMASIERAIQFVDLALRNGAFVKDSAWEKVKQTDKLKVLTAFVEEQTIRIMEASYSAKVPQIKAPETSATEASETEEVAEETSEDWS